MCFWSDPFCSEKVVSVLQDLCYYSGQVVFCFVACLSRAAQLFYSENDVVVFYSKNDVVVFCSKNNLDVSKNNVMVFYSKNGYVKSCCCENGVGDVEIF